MAWCHPALAKANAGFTLSIQREFDIFLLACVALAAAFRSLLVIEMRGLSPETHGRVVYIGEVI